MKPIRTLRQRLGMCWLLLALVVAPALGLVHQVAHGAGARSDVQAVQTTASHAVDAIHKLFSAHTKAECVLLDQIALGHALVAKPLPLLQMLPAAIPVVDVSAGVAEQHAAPFRARGPPSVQKA